MSDDFVLSSVTFVPPEALVDLYDSVGWSAYTRDPAVLTKAVGGSDCVFIVREDGQLIGLARAISDDASVVYVQDILVRPSHQGKGLGRALVNAILKRYSHVRQKVLLTDDRPEQLRFYESLGFRNTRSPPGLHSTRSSSSREQNRVARRLPLGCVDQDLVDARQNGFRDLLTQGTFATDLDGCRPAHLGFRCERDAKCARDRDGDLPIRHRLLGLRSDDGVARGDAVCQCACVHAAVCVVHHESRARRTQQLDCVLTRLRVGAAVVFEDLVPSRQVRILG